MSLCVTVQHNLDVKAECTLHTVMGRGDCEFACDCSAELGCES